MIDTELLKYLPDEYKPRLVAYEEMFRTKGFQQLEEFFKQTAAEKKERVLLARTWDEYIYARAEWIVFEGLAELEENTYKEFETIAQGAQEQQIEEVEVEYE